MKLYLLIIWSFPKPDIFKGLPVVKQADALSGSVYVNTWNYYSSRRLKTRKYLIIWQLNGRDLWRLIPSLRMTNSCKGHNIRRVTSFALSSSSGCARNCSAATVVVVNENDDDGKIEQNTKRGACWAFGSFYVSAVDPLNLSSYDVMLVCGTARRWGRSDAALNYRCWDACPH